MLHFTRCHVNALAAICLALVAVCPTQTHADEIQPDIQSLWLELIPVFPDAGPAAEMQPAFRMGSMVHQYQTDIAIGSDGSTYCLCLVYVGPENAYQRQVVLVKYSAAGRPLWHRVLSGEDREEHFLGQDIALDEADNVYIAGAIARRRDRATQVQGLVVSYTAAGRHRWTHEMPHADREATSQYAAIAIQGDAVLLAGSARSRVVRGARVVRGGSMMDAFVTCLRSNGDLVWARQFQADEREHSEAVDIVVTPSGRICVAGNLTYRPLPRNDPRPEQEHGFVMGLDQGGEERWRTVIGQDAIPPGVPDDRVSSGCLSIAVDRDSNLYVLGANSPMDSGRSVPREARLAMGLLMTKLSDAGDIHWAHYIPNKFADNVSGFSPGRLEVGPAGDLWIPGIIDSNMGTPGIMRYDTDGNRLSIVRYAENDHYHACHALGFGPGENTVTVSGLFGPPRGNLLFGQEDNRPAPTPPSFFFARLDAQAGELVELDE